MKREHAWLSLIVVAALLVSACGPEMVTPQPKATTKLPASAAVQTAKPSTLVVPTAGPTQVLPTNMPLDVSRLPVDPGDYHALGPTDAAVTLEEYSDFQ